MTEGQGFDQLLLKKMTFKVVADTGEVVEETSLYNKVTPAIMKGDVTVLRQVQKSLVNLVSPGRFLVRVRRPAGGAGARLLVTLLEAAVGNSPLQMASVSRVSGHCISPVNI